MALPPPIVRDGGREELLLLPSINLTASFKYGNDVPLSIQMTDPRGYKSGCHPPDALVRAFSFSRFVV